MTNDFETQVSDYWKLQTDKAVDHAKEMYRAMEWVKRKILDAEPTNRMLEALGVIGEALAKHERYEQNKSNRSNDA